MTNTQTVKAAMFEHVPGINIACRIFGINFRNEAKEREIRKTVEAAWGNRPLLNFSRYQAPENYIEVEVDAQLLAEAQQEEPKRKAPKLSRADRDYLENVEQSI